jgi:hypothetical protein
MVYDYWCYRKAIFLIKSSAMLRGKFKTGMVIPASGIYQVTHSPHRLPHEVTLLRGETFPKCQKCANAVMFRLIRELSYHVIIRELPWRVALYELPVIDDAASTKTG